MTNLNSLDDILDYAIAMEQAAADLYTKIAEQASADNIRDTFLSFAQEERNHKAKLENVKTGTIELGSTEKVLDLKIADYINDIEITDNSSYQDILVFAMKQEKQAFRLYTDLAERADNDELRQMFLALAHEEANHKLHFEIEYDERVLREN
jgi:rubrerythrin